MKGIPTIVEYAGITWPRARLAEALGVPLKRLATWDRAGLLTPARVELYRHRKRLRQLARSFGITPTQVSVRVCRGMDRYTASTKPVRLHRKRKGPKVTKSNLSKKKPGKRFAHSFTRDEFYALEGALRGMAKSTRSERLAKMHKRVKDQLERYEVAQCQAIESQEVQAAE